MPKALFLLKRREDYSQDPTYSGSYQIATGMWNSANFVVQALNANGLLSSSAGVEIITDANVVDAVVTEQNPSLVIFEGLWVTPDKIAELKSLYRHRNRTWMVRIHSDIPFLATEGVAMEWIGKFLELGVVVAPNDPRAHNQLREYGLALGYSQDDLKLLMPLLTNCYPTNFNPVQGLDTSAKDTIDVACFGAYRPLKNHLQQAIVAVRFASAIGKKLRFHVNNRQDQGGNSPFRNVKGFFDELNRQRGNDQYALVEHGWEDRETFIQSLTDVDLLMQVSLNETFNIVAADAVFAGRPVLASDEIPWIYPLTADPVDAVQTLRALETIWANKAFFITQNRRLLTSYAEQSAAVWTRYVTAVA